MQQRTTLVTIRAPVAGIHARVRQREVRGARGPRVRVAVAHGEVDGRQHAPHVLGPLDEDDVEGRVPGPEGLADVVACGEGGAEEVGAGLGADVKGGWEAWLEDLRLVGVDRGGPAGVAWWSDGFAPDEDGLGGDGGELPDLEADFCGEVGEDGHSRGGFG